MSLTIVPYWPEITEEEQLEGPGFYNDYRAWTSFLELCSEQEELADELEALGLAALLSYYTPDDMDECDIGWVTPDELESASLKLRQMVLGKEARATNLLNAYAKSANGVREIHVEMAQDLHDLTELAKYASKCGARNLTLMIS